MAIIDGGMEAGLGLPIIQRTEAARAAVRVQLSPSAPRASGLLANAYSAVHPPAGQKPRKAGGGLDNRGDIPTTVGTSLRAPA